MVVVAVVIALPLAFLGSMVGGAVAMVGCVVAIVVLIAASAAAARTAAAFAVVPAVVSPLRARTEEILVSYWPDIDADDAVRHGLLEGFGMSAATLGEGARELSFSEEEREALAKLKRLPSDVARQLSSPPAGDVAALFDMASTLLTKELAAAERTLPRSLRAFLEPRFFQAPTTPVIARLGNVRREGGRIAEPWAASSISVRGEREERNMWVVAPATRRRQIPVYKRPTLAGGVLEVPLGDSRKCRPMRPTLSPLLCRSIV